MTRARILLLALLFLSACGGSTSEEPEDPRVTIQPVDCKTDRTRCL